MTENAGIMSDPTWSIGSSSYELGELSSESVFILELALPDDAYAEAELAHRPFLSLIPRLVGGDLLTPPSMVRLWQASESTGLVSVPEAPMNEDAPSLRLVGDVRASGEITRTNPIPSTEPMQKTTDLLFGNRVALTHGLHADRRLGRNDVEGGF